MTAMNWRVSRPRRSGTASSTLATSPARTGVSLAPKRRPCTRSSSAFVTSNSRSWRSALDVAATENSSTHSAGVIVPVLPQS